MDLHHYRYEQPGLFVGEGLLGKLDPSLPFAVLKANVVEEDPGLGLHNGVQVSGLGRAGNFNEVPAFNLKISPRRPAPIRTHYAMPEFVSIDRECVKFIADHARG
jgi:hypothetical protein